MDKRENDIMEKLLLEGALEFSGIDSETGDMLYNFTPKLKDVMPELYKEHLNHVHSEIMRLWQMGYLEVDITSDNPIVGITPLAMSESALNSLSKEDRWVVEEIKRLYKAKEF